MKPLSTSLVGVLLVSSFLSATCGIECDREAQAPAGSRALHHALHTANSPDGPFTSAGQHPCGAHGEWEAVFSPGRFVQNKILALPTEVFQDGPGSVFASHDRLRWLGRQRGSPGVKPHPISLRI